MDDIGGEDVTFIAFLFVALTVAVAVVHPVAGVTVFGIGAASAVAFRFADALDGELVAEDEADVDPVTRLQNRVAEGEITPEEMEEKLDAMIDAQQVADEHDLDTEELEFET